MPMLSVMLSSLGMTMSDSLRVLLDCNKHVMSVELSFISGTKSCDTSCPRCREMTGYAKFSKSETLKVEKEDD